MTYGSHTLYVSEEEKYIIYLLPIGKHIIAKLWLSIQIATTGDTLLQQETNFTRLLDPTWNITINGIRRRKILSWNLYEENFQFNCYKKFEIFIFVQIFPKYSPTVLYLIWKSNQIAIYIFICLWLKLMSIMLWIITLCISPKIKNRTQDINSKGLFTPKTRVFSAAEILLRIYQNHIHLNGTRWRTRLWRQREIRRRKKVVRQRAPFKCVGFWYIRSRISAAEQTHVFGLNRPSRLS